MEKFKEYARVAWAKYKEVVADYPATVTYVALVIGFALGYWVG